jgi:hypothetical protein
MSEIIHIPTQQLISPYVLTPFHQLVEQPRPVPPIVKCLAYLTNPPDLETDPYWQTEVGRCILVYRNFCVCEFIRIAFDKRVNVWQFRKQDSKQVKDQVRLEAKLWQACWTLISLMHSHTAAFSQEPTRNPAETTLLLILERQLVQFVFLHDSEMEGTSATQYIKRVQWENRCLQKIDAQNPFSHSSFTGQFIDNALQLAELSDPIRKAMADVVGARMKLVTHWKKTYPTSYGTKSAEKRGRKRLSK